MIYQVRLAPRAERELKKLFRQIQSRIKKKIDLLGENPLPDGVKKMAGNDSLFRVRVGDYRIVYVIENERLTVLIVAVGHRREIYRR